MKNWDILGYIEPIVCFKANIVRKTCNIGGSTFCFKMHGVQSS